MRVLDVGCGPGALAVELAGRVGENNVAAIDPTPQFTAACQTRIPSADVREGVAESLPWDDGTFDAAMCSLVVAWMSDADQGIGEMARVTKPGGTVAAAMCGTSPAAGCRCSRTSGTLRVRSTRASPTSSRAPACAKATSSSGSAAPACRASAAARSRRASTTPTSTTTGSRSPATPVALPGAFCASLDDAGKAILRDTVRASLPEGPFTLPARAWLALGTVPG